MFFPEYPYRNIEDYNLDYVLKHIKEVLKAVSDMDEWIKTHQAEYEQLKALYDAIVSGNFPPGMYATLYNWVVVNSPSIFGELAKMVIFNITDDGYFVAYIPESWDDILFGTTGLDEIIPGYDYGRLVLSYNIP